MAKPIDTKIGPTLKERAQTAVAQILSLKTSVGSSVAGPKTNKTLSHAEKLVTPGKTTAKKRRSTRKSAKSKVQSKNIAAPVPEDPVVEPQVVQVEERASSAVPMNRRCTNWPLEAVRKVRLRMGQGFRRGAAQLEMASELNKSIDDLQAWERELVKISEFENELVCCELAGEFYDYLVSGHYTNVPKYKSYGSFEGVANIERAAKVVREMRRVSIAEIRAGLRTRRRMGDPVGVHGESFPN